MDFHSDVVLPVAREMEIVIALEVMDFDSVANEIAHGLDDFAKSRDEIFVASDPQIEDVADHEEMSRSVRSALRFRVKRAQELEECLCSRIFARNEVEIGDEVSSGHLLQIRHRRRRVFHDAFGSLFITYWKY